MKNRANLGFTRSNGDKRTIEPILYGNIQDMGGKSVQSRLEMPSPRPGSGSPDELRLAVKSTNTNQGLGQKYYNG